MMTWKNKRAPSALCSASCPDTGWAFQVWRDEKWCWVFIAGAGGERGAYGWHKRILYQAAVCRVVGPVRWVYVTRWCAAGARAWTSAFRRRARHAHRGPWRAFIHHARTVGPVVAPKAPVPPCRGSSQHRRRA